MRYIKAFELLTGDKEERTFSCHKFTCYDSYYPFSLFPKKNFSHIDFSDVTMFYGGNGTGKSTVLNIIASKIEAERTAVYNRSNFWEDYVDRCEIEYEREIPDNRSIITSDDVFDYMLDIRNMNMQIDVNREERMKDAVEYRHKKFRFESLDQLDELRKINLARSKTTSQYVRNTIANNVREFSNGESAYMYFVNHIKEDGIYILDEPENSLSPEKQLELIKFIEDSVRFFNCQFIISTHSPFMLAMKDALIYDMDGEEVRKSKWTDLKNVRMYYDFFKAHDREFLA